MIDKPTNKIEAIKVIRNLPVKIDFMTGENGVTYQAVKLDISLLEVKNLVEAIMVIEPGNSEELKKQNDDLRRIIEAWKDKYYEMRNSILQAIEKADR